MGKLKKIRLLFTFYKGFFLSGFLISIACSGILFDGGMAAFTMVFWYKISSMVIIWSFINSYKKKEFFYYQNLGMSKLQLWTFALSIDFILFIGLTILSPHLNFFSFLLEYKM